MTQTELDNKPSKTKRGGVIVLGMHRSGTSLMTNLLSKAGFYAGKDDDLMEGNEWNRDGYFERWSVVDLNDSILKLCGGAWDSPPDEKKILSINISEIIESLLEAYEGKANFIIKDPRMCLTFPAWRKALGDDIKIIRIDRDEDAVADSLYKRDSFTKEKSLELRSIYLERADKYSKEYITFSIRYENLFNGKRAEILKALSIFLDIETDLEAIASKTVDPSLNHFASGADSGTPHNARKGPAVSIIIPLFNKVAYTIKCWGSIVKNTADGLYELIIVDNASSDSTGDFLKCLGDKVKIISNKKNLGFSKACNQGAEAASTNYLLFLNNDTEAEENWLEPLLEVVDKDSSVAAVGSKLLFPDGTLQHAGVAIIDDKKDKEPLVPRHIYYQESADFPEANEMRSYQVLTGASLLVRKTVFWKAGGFDEGFWNGYEDVDLCFKIQEMGHKLVYQPQSVLIHHESVSGPERFTKVDKNTERLKKRWIGKIEPDLIVDEEGVVRDTPTCKVKPYALPGEALQKFLHVRPDFQQRLTSIVILTFNQLKYTKECVESIRANTPEAHEIIFVDNGSKDGTTKWLKQLCKENDNYRLIENKKNLGFAAGCNQGIKGSEGEYILLLNNDVVVTRDWLSGMIECIRSSDEIGIVGPMTNSISGPQKVEEVGYDAVDRLNDYADSFRLEQRHRWIPARRVVGFCMLFRRELVGRIGFLDEDFGSGNFEDDDYCLRAALEGYRNLIAGDVFIHHYGSASFKGNRINYASAMAANRKIFTKKWSGIDGQTPLGKKLLALNAIDDAEALNRKGELARAVRTLIDAIKRSPKDKSLLYALSEILIDVKQHTEALEMLKKTYGDEQEPKRLTLMGQCKAGLGDSDEAGAYAEKALMIDPDFAPALNLKGVIEYNNGDKPAAEGSFKKAIQSDPSLGETYKNLGLLKLEDKKREEALELLEKAFILSPASTEIATTYHIAITETGTLESCEKRLREAMHFFPRDKRMSFLLIDVLLKQGKDDAAMREIEGVMLDFGIDNGTLSAAIEVRERLDAEKGVKKAKGKPSLSLCMIVKNEEKYLASCLASISPIVDEMIVVDTGSTDRTKDIARAFGAQLYDFEWTGDFSEARNYSLTKATGDWVLILDADEVVSLLDHARLSKLISKKSAAPAAYSIETRNYVRPSNIAGWTINDGGYSTEEAGTGWFPGSKVRLFTNDSRIQFENPVHELVEPSLKKLRIKIKKCPVPVHHYGKLDMNKNASKGEEYYLMGKKKLDQMGGDVLAIRELAIQAGELGRYDDAAELWESVIKIKPHMDDAYLNLGHAYLELGRYEEALAASKKAVKAAPQMKEALLNYSMSELYTGDINKSLSTLEKLTKKHPDYPSARLLLAVACCCDGKKEKGLKLFGNFAKEDIEISGAISCYIEKLIAAGKCDYADKLRNAAAEGNNLNKDTLHVFAKRDHSDNELCQSA